MSIRGFALGAICLPFCCSAAMAAAPPGFITGVYAGQPDAANVVPNFNLVPNTNDSNLDIPVPQAILNHGMSYDYIVSLQVYGFSGPCKITYSLSQVIDGTTTTLQDGHIAAFTCSGGNELFTYYIVGRPVPDSPGPATLSATVTFGTTKVTQRQQFYIQ